MKILLIFMCTFLAAFIDDRRFTEFYDDVKDAYSIYEIDGYENERYVLKVAKGIMNNEPTYGIAFQSYEEGYTLVIKQNDVLYQLNSVDHYYAAYAIKADADIYLCLYDSKGRKIDFEEFAYSRLDSFSVQNFEPINPQNGRNEGGEYEVLEVYKMKVPYYKIYTIVCLSIIAVSSVFVLIKLIINYKKKPQKTRKEIEKEIDEMVAEYVVQSPKNEALQAIVREKTKPIFEEDFEQLYIKDLKEHLVLNGFVADYQLMDDKEKNELTIYLMKLRDNKEISNDQYLEEMYKLWKS